MKKVLVGSVLTASLGMLTGAPAQATSANVNLTASSPTAVVCAGNNDNVLTMQVYGTWTGSVAAAASLTQANPASVAIYPYNSATAGTLTTNGVYQAQISGGVCVTLTGSTLTGTAQIQLNTSSGGLASGPLASTVTTQFPYSGTTDAQTLTTASFTGLGFVDSTGKFTRWKSAKAFDSAASDNIPAMQLCDLNTLVCAHLTANREFLAAPSSGGHQQTIGANGAAQSTICDPTASNTCAPLTGVGNQDRNSSGFNALTVGSYQLAYAGGGNWDRTYKDTYAAGPTWSSNGGATTATIAAGTGTTVIKASAGRIAGYTITTAGTTGDTLCYDNASTGSGTILLVVAGATSNASSVRGYSGSAAWAPPAVNGITCVGAANSPAFTISFW